MKPLGYRAYGSIAHLPNSRMGVGDHHCHEGQGKIATQKVRDKHDLVIVQEKLDGSNVSVAKLHNRLIPLTRSGHDASTSPYSQHIYWTRWVTQRASLFDALLREGERVCGEWLLQAHGTRYDLTNHAPFIAFDLFLDKDTRLPYHAFKHRLANFELETIEALFCGNEAVSVEKALQAVSQSRYGAIDEVEGAIWRVERKGEVDFLAKFVRHNKQDGYFLPQHNGLEREIWNLPPVWLGV
jgi:RNA ligase